MTWVDVVGWSLFALKAAWTFVVPLVLVKGDPFAPLPALRFP